MFYSFRTLFILILTCISLNQAMAEDGLNQPMTFINAYNGGNCIGCEWIAAEGNITADTPAAFKKFINENYQRSLVINSKGGDLAAALELGKLFRQHKLDLSIGHAWTDTNSESYKNGFRFHEIIDGICTEACAYALLGGATRYAQVGNFGFKTVKNSNVSQNQLINYIMQMGMNMDILLPLTKTAKNETYFPNDQELIHSGIDNLTALYSKPKLVAFGKNNGKIVETKHLSGYQSNPQDPRIYRLYCRGAGKAPHFAVLENHNKNTANQPDRWEKLAKLIQKVNIQYNGVGFDVTPVKVAAYFNGKNTKAIAFELLNISAEKFKDIKSISIMLIGVPKEFTPDISQMQADFGNSNQLLGQALQNCVE